MFRLSAGLTGLMFDRLRNDVEIHYPGFRVPLSIERGMNEKYWRIQSTEVVVEVRSGGKGGYAWFPYTKKSLVQLDENEHDAQHKSA